MRNTAPELIDYVDRREAVFIALAMYDGTESPVLVWSIQMNQQLPLMTTKEVKLPDLIEAAERTAILQGVVVRVAKFTAREDIAVFDHSEDTSETSAPDLV